MLAGRDDAECLCRRGKDRRGVPVHHQHHPVVRRHRPIPNKKQQEKQREREGENAMVRPRMLGWSRAVCYAAPIVRKLIGVAALEGMDGEVRRRGDEGADGQLLPAVQDDRRAHERLGPVLLRRRRLKLERLGTCVEDVDAAVDGRGPAVERKSTRQRRVRR